MEQVADIDALVLRQKSTKMSSKVHNVSAGMSKMKQLFALQNEAIAFGPVVTPLLRKRYRQAGSKGFVNNTRSAFACNLQRNQEMPAEKILGSHYCFTFALMAC